MQSSLVGSILSNILLVLGMCFFAGGLRFAEQSIKSTAAQLNSSLLLIAVIAVLIPSAFHSSITVTQTGDGLSLTQPQEANDLLAMSHAVAVLLLVLYLGYLLFQMWTHASFYEDGTGGTSSSQYPDDVRNFPEKMKRYAHRKKRDEESGLNESPLSTGTGSVEAPAHPNADGPIQAPVRESNDEEEQEPQMNIYVTVVSLKY